MTPISRIHCLKCDTEAAYTAFRNDVTGDVMVHIRCHGERQTKLLTEKDFAANDRRPLTLFVFPEPSGPARKPGRFFCRIGGRQ